MYRFSAMTALLLLSQASAFADDPPPTNSSNTPWLQRVFGSSEPAPAPTADTPPRPIKMADVTRSYEQEYKIYLERLQFCTSLRAIADQTDDAELARKSEELEKLAERVYTKRTATLKTRVQDAKAAEAALDQHNTGPSGTASTNRTVTGHYPNGRPIMSQE